MLIFGRRVESHPWMAATAGLLVLTYFWWSRGFLPEVTIEFISPFQEYGVPCLFSAGVGVYVMAMMMCPDKGIQKLMYIFLLIALAFTTKGMQFYAKYEWQHSVLDCFLYATISLGVVEFFAYRFGIVTFDTIVQQLVNGMYTKLEPRLKQIDPVLRDAPHAISAIRNVGRTATEAKRAVDQVKTVFEDTAKDITGIAREYQQGAIASVHEISNNFGMMTFSLSRYLDTASLMLVGAGAMFVARILISRANPNQPQSLKNQKILMIQAILACLVSCLALYKGINWAAFMDAVMGFLGYRYQEIEYLRGWLKEKFTPKGMPGVGIDNVMKYEAMMKPKTENALTKLAKLTAKVARSTTEQELGEIDSDMPTVVGAAQEVLKAAAEKAGPSQVEIPVNKPSAKPPTPPSKLNKVL